MVGKDKTAKAGKGKKALESEWAEAVAAADSGDRFTGSAANMVKGGGGGKGMSPDNPNYDPDYANKIAAARGKRK
jgi:hypothetical protein